MNTTELQAAVERLAEQASDQRTRPADRDGWIAAALALRNALAEIQEAAINVDFHIAERLTAEGLVTKRCAREECRRWMIVTARGRRRRTCSDACRVALARSR